MNHISLICLCHHPFHEWCHGGGVKIMKCVRISKRALKGDKRYARETLRERERTKEQLDKRSGIQTKEKLERNESHANKSSMRRIALGITLVM